MQKPAALFLSKNQQVFGNTASLLQIKVNKGRQALPYSPKAAEKGGLDRLQFGLCVKRMRMRPKPAAKQRACGNPQGANASAFFAHEPRLPDASLRIFA